MGDLHALKIRKKTHLGFFSCEFQANQRIQIVTRLGWHCSWLYSFSAELKPASTTGGKHGTYETWRPKEQRLKLKICFHFFQVQAIQFQASGMEKETYNQCLRVLIAERNLRRFGRGCASNTFLVNRWSLNKSTTAWLLLGQISNSSRLRSVLGFVKHWTLWPMWLCLKIRWIVKNCKWQTPQITQNWPSL